MAAEIKIHLRFNVETGKKDIVVEYDSEDDAMAWEHEQRHRELVEQLVGSGVLDPNDVGNVRVGRVEGEGRKQADPQQQPQAEKQSVGEG